jgi:hypothetical protein
LKLASARTDNDEMFRFPASIEEVEAMSWKQLTPCPLRRKQEVTEAAKRYGYCGSRRAIGGSSQVASHAEGVKTAQN